jgi:hypothetical protein
MIVTLRNSFHGTSTNIRLQVESDGLARVSKDHARRVRARLCGYRSCTCSGTFGERGRPHSLEIERMYETGYEVFVCVPEED